MKNTIRLIALFSFAMMLWSCSTEEQKQPNIIFLFADDQAYTTVGALGNDDIITPNLDKLCESGVSFTNTFNMGAWNGAVCLASRAMLNTGRFMWRAQTYDKDKKLWSELMKDAGYETYMTGKWHTHGQPKNLFDNVEHVRGGMPNDTWPAYMKNWTADKPLPNGYNRPQSPDDHTWSPSDKSKEGHWKGGEHWSKVLGDDAVGFINKAKGGEKPFFMYLAFSAPHDPRQAPQEYQDMYDLNSLKLPVSYAPDYKYRDSIGCGPMLRDAALCPFPRTEFAVRTHIKEYYASITYLDAQVGRIINALKESGELDNTYIFYTADHGLAVGEHGLMGKQHMYDHSMRVPFFVIGPDVPQHKKQDVDIYLQDVMATALDLAGAEKPEYIEFNSLMPFINKKRETSFYPAIYGSYQDDLQRMIRKDGYKLILYPHGKTMLLYDMNNDPLEMNDLSSDAKYQKIKTQLFNDLVDLQQEMGDPLDLRAIFNI